MGITWSREQTEQLRLMVSQGLSWKQISGLTGRSPNSVKERWRTIHRSAHEKKERQFKDKACRKVKQAARPAHERASVRLLALLHEHHDFNMKLPPGYVRPVSPAEWADLHSALDKAEPPQDKFPQVAHIKRVVAAHFGVTPMEIDSPRRDKMVVRSRQVAMYLAKALTPRSFPSIGKRFGKDHTTVIHSVRSVEGLIASDPAFAAKVDAMKSMLS